MPEPIFYINPASIKDSEAFLDKTESNHATSVLRMREGDRVILVDGLGNAFRGSVGTLSKSKTIIRIYDQLRNFGEPAAKVTLAAGLSTVGKFDTVVEKGTELGVTRFVPLQTEKSKVKLGDLSKRKSRVTRLEKVALAAIKQSRRSYRPEISLPIDFDQFMDETDNASLNLLFHPDPKALSINEAASDHSTKRVTVLVGPESGFSPVELELAALKGFKTVSLGSRILRAETAGPVAVALVMNALGEFR